MGPKNDRPRDQGELILKDHHGRVQLRRASLDLFSCTVIVNEVTGNLQLKPANMDLHRIAETAGPNLQEVLRRMLEKNSSPGRVNQVKVGSAFSTGPQLLPHCKEIFHVVPPNLYPKRGSLDKQKEAKDGLGKVYQEALRLAIKKGVTRIAFPSIQPEGFDKFLATNIAMKSVSDFLETPEGDLIYRVYFVMAPSQGQDQDNYKLLFETYFQMSKYNPVPGTRYFWQPNPEFRNDLEPPENEDMEKERALFEDNQGPWPAWRLHWSRRRNRWEGPWRRDNGLPVTAATDSAAAVDPNLPGASDASSKEKEADEKNDAAEAAKEEVGKLEGNLTKDRKILEEAEDEVLRLEEELTKLKRTVGEAKERIDQIEKSLPEMNATAKNLQKEADEAEIAWQDQEDIEIDLEEKEKKEQQRIEEKEKEEQQRIEAEVRARQDALEEANQVMEDEKELRRQMQERADQRKRDREKRGQDVASGEVVAQGKGNQDEVAETESNRDRKGAVEKQKATQENTSQTATAKSTVAGFSSVSKAIQAEPVNIMGSVVSNVSKKSETEPPKNVLPQASSNLWETGEAGTANTRRPWVPFGHTGRKEEPEKETTQDELEDDPPSWAIGEPYPGAYPPVKVATGQKPDLTKFLLEDKIDDIISKKDADVRDLNWSIWYYGWKHKRWPAEYPEGPGIGPYPEEMQIFRCYSNLFTGKDLMKIAHDKTSTAMLNKSILYYWQQNKMWPRKHPRGPFISPGGIEMNKDENEEEGGWQNTTKRKRNDDDDDAGPTKRKTQAKPKATKAKPKTTRGRGGGGRIPRAIDPRSYKPSDGHPEWQ